MPFNGAGLYSPPAADFPAVANTLIESTHFNNVINDIATALSTCITKDGQTVVTQNIPFGGFALTGVGSGLAARTRAANIGDVQDGTTQWVAFAGTADAITATYAPALTALIDGQICMGRASAANATTTPTFAPNGLTARTIVRQGGSALSIGDIPAALAEVILRYNLANTRWELLNPALMLPKATGGSDGQAFERDSSQAAGYSWVDNPSRPNLLVNPNWQIDQINEGALYTVTGGSGNVQGPDGWTGVAVAAPGVFKVRTLADPDDAALKCLEITCTTIDAAIGAADDYHIEAAIEGYDAAALAAGTAFAQSITIQFKLKISLAGVYGVSIANSAKNRSYVGIITVPDANEHEYSLAVPMDTAGTWLYTNGVGLYLRLTLAAGANFQTAAGAWGANNMLTTAAQANFMSNVANIAYLKRISLVPGVLPQSYKPADFWKDLAKAQRYYFKTIPQGTAVATGAGVSGAAMYQVMNAVITTGVDLRFPATMRASPTLTTYNPTSANAKWRNTTDAADQNVLVVETTAEHSYLQCTDAVATERILRLHVSANARLS